MQRPDQIQIYLNESRGHLSSGWMWLQLTGLEEGLRRAGLLFACGFVSGPLSLICASMAAGMFEGLGETMDRTSRSTLLLGGLSRVHPQQEVETSYATR